MTRRHRIRYQDWLMPLWAASTAALGSYIGVIRAISDLREEVRVVRADYTATARALDGRLERAEAAATQTERRCESLVRHHEQAFHHRGRGE
ncbi:MAG TPA: hypothetical protein PK251_12905 [Candidatus Latescibacteria bacterium]|nr:hypothetical protein [Candidatus Latescibacterota bacterium]HPC45817.1 hypothetical protein [Candidatus Latescibacterota bacterium]HPK75539.1 hypothetical protein [Candidatus Latescibacterota bacterium]HQI77617.1 hypothetical protein [Candidatus Latescibacterota bacterium]HRS96196.1 hypothetical protein [Candidatus Latescibacterota bacterium]